MSLTIRVLSDIHLDHGTKFKIVYTGEDVLIIAGDLCNNFNRDDGLAFIKHYLTLNETVIVLYVLGNHEYYGGTIDEVDNFWETVAVNRLTVFGKTPKQLKIKHTGRTINFIGCTLWTDLKQGRLVWKAADFLNDFTFIRDFTEDSFRYVTLHENTVEQMQLLLSKNTVEPIIMITHHPPFENSVTKYFKDDDLNRLFHSNLEHLVQPNMRLWIHGHVHSSCNYAIEKCHVVCNPFYENPNFNKSLILQI
jgi:Icc-related predicted phosphoesterase